MKKSIYSLIIVTAFCICIPQQVLASDADAKKAFKEGTRHFNDGEYILASAAFRKAYSFKPTWKLLFNIGQADAAAKRYGLALEALEGYMAKGGDDIKQVRVEQLMAEISRLRMLVGMLEVDAPPGSVIMVDDFERATLPSSRPIRIAVGQHVIQIIVDGQVAHEEDIEIVGNLTATVSYGTTPAPPEEEVKLADDSDPQADKNGFEEDSGETIPRNQPAPGKRDKILLISGISAAVIAVGGITLGTIGSLKFSKDNDEWEKAKDAYELTGLDADFQDARTAHSDAKTDLTLVTVGFIVGGVFAATSVVLFSLRKKKESAVAFKPSLGSISLTF